MFTSVTLTTLIADHIISTNPHSPPLVEIVFVDIY